MVKPALLALFTLLFLAPGGQGEKNAVSRYSVFPIGYVRKEEGKTKIVLERDFQPGLDGLDGFSHVYVLYWFDRNDVPEKRSILKVHPRGDLRNPLTGVFATRSPMRPNLIALSLCRIVSIHDNVLEVQDIDALPDTPVLDLKPFVPGMNPEDAEVPDWIHRSTRPARAHRGQ